MGFGLGSGSRRCRTCGFGEVVDYRSHDPLNTHGRMTRGLPWLRKTHAKMTAAREERKHKTQSHRGACLQQLRCRQHDQKWPHQGVLAHKLSDASKQLAGCVIGQCALSGHLSGGNRSAARTQGTCVTTCTGENTGTGEHVGCLEIRRDCAHAMHLQTQRKNSGRGRGMGNQGDTIW